MTSPATQTGNQPWYRHFWPWFIIGLLGTSVAGSIGLLITAVNHQDSLVVTESEYQQIRNDFRPDPASQPDDQDEDAEEDPEAGDEEPAGND